MPDSGAESRAELHPYARDQAKTHTWFDILEGPLI